MKQQKRKFKKSRRKKGRKSERKAEEKQKNRKEKKKILHLYVKQKQDKNKGKWRKKKKKRKKQASPIREIKKEKKRKIKEKIFAYTWCAFFVLYSLFVSAIPEPSFLPVFRFLFHLYVRQIFAFLSFYASLLSDAFFLFLLFSFFPF